MKWIKQSAALYKTKPRQSLYIAVAALGILVLGSLWGLIGVLFTSVGLIFLEAYIFLKLSGREIRLRDAKKFPAPKSLLVLSIIMIPTNMMLGALVGLLQGSESREIQVILIGVFSLVCSYVYILIFHSVGFVVLRGCGLRQAADESLKGLNQNKKSLLSLGLLLILMLVVAAIPMGAGLVFALPVALYSYYFSFSELYPVSVDRPEL